LAKDNAGEEVKFDAKAAAAVDRGYLTPEIVNQRIRTLDALALRAGERVLDVGCGSGLLAHDMALQVGLEGQVVGIDLSADMLDLGRERCAGMDQVDLRQGKIPGLPVEDGDFDAAACTQLLLFVADVDAALADIHRALKPGGRLAVIETDWRGAVVNSADPELTRRMFAAWDAKAASPNLPGRLSPMLRDKGFAVTRIEAIPVLNTSRSPGAFSTGMTKHMAKTAKELEVVTAEQAAAWLDDLDRLEAEGAYFFCVNRFLFSAVKL